MGCNTSSTAGSSPRSNGAAVAPEEEDGGDSAPGVTALKKQNGHRDKRKDDGSRYI